MSCGPPVPKPEYVDDEDELQKVLRASAEEVEKETAKKAVLRKKEDDSVLFQAALRASCVDLGPRGISQPAKIFSSGDASLGQSNVVAQTGSHVGAGGRFKRASSTVASLSSSGSSSPPALGSSRTRPSVTRQSSALQETGKVLANRAR